MTTKFDQLWKSLEDEEMRREFNLDVDTTLAFQIKLLRERNGWTQQQVAERVGSKQETISQWENPNYGRYTLKTLKSLATAFDVGLMVKFAPFSEIVKWNAGLSPRHLAPPSFAEEHEARLRRVGIPETDLMTTLWARVARARHLTDDDAGPSHGDLSEYLRSLRDSGTDAVPMAPTTTRVETQIKEKEFGFAA